MLAGVDVPAVLPADIPVAWVFVTGDVLPEGLDGVLLPGDAPLFRRLRDEGRLLPAPKAPPLFPAVAAAISHEGTQVAVPFHARISQLLTCDRDAAGVVEDSGALTQIIQSGSGSMPAAAWSAWGLDLYALDQRQALLDMVSAVASLPQETEHVGAFCYRFGSPFHRTHMAQGWQPLLPARDAPIRVSLWVGAAIAGSPKADEMAALLADLMARVDGESMAYISPEAAPVDTVEYTAWLASAQASLATLAECAGAGEKCMRMDEFDAQRAELEPYRRLIDRDGLQAIAQEAHRLSAGLAALPYDPAAAEMENALLRWQLGCVTVQAVRDLLAVP